MKTFFNPFRSKASKPAHTAAGAGRYGWQGLRERLADSRGLLLLSAWSVVVGVLAGLVIVVFNLALEYVPDVVFAGDESLRGFEQWPPMWRLLVPLGGGLLLGLAFQFLKQYGEVGIPHVLAALVKRDGELKFRNAAVQFFAALFALLSGQSLGKEGPAVHVGAACGSNLSKRAGLPNTTTRVLVASGSAAAIAAAFDTPLAGVVFAMEVILMEYTIAGFAPIIMATVAATTVTRAAASLLGEEYASGVELAVPDDLSMRSLTELPWLIVCGLVIGAIAAGFVRFIRGVAATSRRVPIWIRLTFAGLLTGAIGYVLPQVLGVGYDTLSGLLETQSVNTVSGNAIASPAGLFDHVFSDDLAAAGWLPPEWLLLIGLLLAKFLATGVSVGMGMPAGLIGPTLLLGALAGCVLGWVGYLVFPDSASSPGYYALVGMGAMMAAVLQAPLAALLALLELTANPDVILPGMLVSVTAYLTCRVVLNQPPVFRMLLRRRGLNYRTDPISMGLRHSTVMDAMDRQVRQIEGDVSLLSIEELQELKLNWLLFNLKDKDFRLLPFQKVITRQRTEKKDNGDGKDAEMAQQDAVETVDLNDFTNSTISAREIDWRMTLAVARSLFEEDVEALYVTTNHRRLGKQVLGVLTPDILQTYIRTSLH